MIAQDPWRPIVYMTLLFLWKLKSFINKIFANVSTHFPIILLLKKLCCWYLSFLSIIYKCSKRFFFKVCKYVTNLVLIYKSLIVDFKRTRNLFITFNHLQRTGKLDSHKLPEKYFSTSTSFLWLLKKSLSISSYRKRIFVRKL